MKPNMKTASSLLTILLAFAGGPLLASAPETQQAKAPDPVTATSSDEVPSPLLDMEQLAEKVVVLASNEDWKDVQPTVTKIRTDWLDFEPLDPTKVEPGSMQRMEYALEQLAAVSARHERVVTVLAANEVSSTAMEVYSLFHPTIPAAVQRLDEHQRRILLDTALQQYQDAEIELQGSNRIWYFFKPAVLYRNGRELVDGFQAQLDMEEEFIHSKQRSDLLGTAQQALVSLYQISDLMD